MTDGSHAGRATWNRLSAAYQARRAGNPDTVEYGPWAPTEDELHLLGDVAGCRVLEIGCGGGQAAVALARRGAQVTAIDISDAQIAHAQRLAAQAGVAVHFQRGEAANLAWCATGSQALVVSIYAFPYVAEMARCLQECRRVLRPGGRLVFSLDHPLRACFFDEVDQELVVYPVRSYYAAAPVRWTFDDTDVPMQSHHRTIAGWIDLLHGHGFRLLRLLEPQPAAAVLDHFWPPEDALAPLRHIPHTAIFVAQAGPD